MTRDRKKQIGRRGEILAKLCREILEQDPSDPVATAGFKWGFLLLEKPRAYFENFRHGGLDISEFELEQAIHDFDSYLPGENYLCWDEREILERHNQESEKWKRATKQPATGGIGQTVSPAY